MIPSLIKIKNLTKRAIYGTICTKGLKESVQVNDLMERLEVYYL